MNRRSATAVLVGVVVALAGAGALVRAHDPSPAWNSNAAAVAAPAPEPETPADSNSDDSSADTFHDYACTDDCSGHRAGFAWAEEQDITDPDDCPIDPHNSHSFTEGCWAFAGRDGP